MKKNNRRGIHLSGSKGNAILDSVTILVILFMLGIASIIGIYLLQTFNTEVQADDGFNNLTKEHFSTQASTMPGLYDGLFIFFLGMFWAAALLASWFIDTHPIFLVAAIILLIVLIILGAYMSNIFDEVISSDGITTTADSFPITKFVMRNLPYFVLAIAFTIAIVLYGKSKIE